jgi:hypothetical protein
MLRHRTLGSPDNAVRVADHVDTISKRTRAEYLEMPGLRLKPEQAQRLFGIEPTICRQVLDSLVEEKFLCVKSDGSYARVTEGIPSPRPLKADLATPDRSRGAA